MRASRILMLAGSSLTISVLGELPRVSHVQSLPARNYFIFLLLILMPLNLVLVLTDDSLIVLQRLLMRGLYFIILQSREDAPRTK